MPIDRPAAGEYAPYYQKYLDQIGDAEDLFDVLRAQPAEMRRVLEALGEERADHRYAPGKWSVKEAVGHVLDTERIFAYRALRIARGDTTPLPGFEQDAYVANAPTDAWTLDELAGAFERLRAANVDLFAHFDDAAMRRTGTASGHPVSVRALVYMAAGHARHHLRIFEERYR